MDYLTPILWLFDALTPDMPMVVPSMVWVEVLRMVGLV